MSAIIVTIETQQPLLVTSFQGDPNSDVSYPYIPGSSLRGALIGRYMKKNGLSELDLSDPATNRLFFNAAHTCYLNAYLCNRDNKRTLPLPYSWFRDKQEELLPEQTIGCFDFSLEKTELVTTPKVLGQGFWSNQGGVVEVCQPQRRISVHHQRDRKTGRPNSANGQIFRYEAIAANQTFQAVILCELGDVETLESLLKDRRLWLGGSRSAGYGKTKITVTVSNTWQEVEKPSDASQAITLTFLSPALLRDRWGQPAADTASVKLALEECFSDLSIPDINAEKTFIKRELVGGFNRKWGLPLPQQIAISAGSVITFKNLALTQKQIEQLEAKGLGERRVDGFGRVAINCWNDKTFKARLAGPKRVDAPTDENRLSADSLSAALAKTIATNILRQRLEQVLIQETGRNKLSPNYLSNSQLSRLELAARSGLFQTSFQPVQDFLKIDNLTKIALKQFQRSRVKSNSFYDQLQEWSDSNPFQWLDSHNSLNQLTVKVSLNPEIQVAIDDDVGRQLATQYTLRLIMAVAKQAKKENAA